jgi:hypothetical protein
MEEIWKESKARMRNAVYISVYSAALVVIGIVIMVIKYC